MRISIFTFGAIASVLALNAFATSSTVTSKDYVDAQDALKQNKIPATGTNASTPGDTVVTYTTTGNGVIGERGIFSDYTEYDWDDGTDEDKLVTAGAVASVINMVDNLPTTGGTYAECYQYDNGNCILWELHGKMVYGNGRSCSGNGEYCSDQTPCCDSQAECYNSVCTIPLM